MGIKNNKLKKFTMGQMLKKHSRAGTGSMNALIRISVTKGYKDALVISLSIKDTLIEQAGWKMGEVIDMSIDGHDATLFIDRS